jgi:hypothetical protein
MAFTLWALYSSLFCFVAYMTTIVMEKGKRYIGRGKLLDQIEDKYDRLRESRREMKVLISLTVATLLLGLVTWREREGSLNGEGDFQD